MALKRKFGAEQPYIPLGIFKLRIPFVHFGWTWPEAVQGIALVATPISAATVVMMVLGIPFELAMLFPVINNLIYLLHTFLGDPLFPGWITPAMALTVAYCMGFSEGIPRIHALIALQLLVGFIFLFMGVSGLAKKIMSRVPDTLRAGILLGAGISAIISVLNNQFVDREISLGLGFILTFAFMFSFKVIEKTKSNNLLKTIAKFGLLPGIAIAYIAGLVTGEITAPTAIFANGLFTPMSLYPQVLKSVTVFGIGFPNISYFVSAIPMAIAAYIIAFGDFVYAEVIIGEADKVRGDEYIEFNPSRSNIISGIRNIIMATFAPFPPLCGPLWGAGVVGVAERYKLGKEGIDSIYDAFFPYILCMWLGLVFMPVVNFFKPILPLAMGLCLLVQGYANGYISMGLIHTNEERGSAALMAIVLATKGAAWGLGIGILLHIIIGFNKKRKIDVQNAIEEIETIKA